MMLLQILQEMCLPRAGWGRWTNCKKARASLHAAAALSRVFFEAAAHGPSRKAKLPAASIPRMVSPSTDNGRMSPNALASCGHSSAAVATFDNQDPMGLSPLTKDR